MTVKPKKCQLGMTQGVYLDHVVEEGQEKAEFSKIEALEKFKRPKMKRDVCTFLGMARYYWVYTTLFNNRLPSNPHLTHWSLFLQLYQYTVECRKRNGNADALCHS